MKQLLESLVAIIAVVVISAGTTRLAQAEPIKATGEHVLVVITAGNKESTTGPINSTTGRASHGVRTPYYVSFQEFKSLERCKTAKTLVQEYSIDRIECLPK